MKFNLNIRVLATVCLLHTSYSPPVKSAESSEQKAWVVEQYNRVDGRSTVYLTPNAIRIVQPGNVVTVSKGPSWDVCVFSIPTKKSYQCPLRRFENRLNKSLAMAYGVNLAVIPLKAGPPTTICGISGISYGTPIKLSWKDFWHGVDDMRKGRYPATVQAMYTPFFKIPAQECEVVCRLHGIPIRKEMPLKFEFTDQDGDTNHHMHTTAVKREKVGVAEFDIPQGYTAAKTLNEVVAGVVNEYMIDTFSGTKK